MKIIIDTTKSIISRIIFGILFILAIFAVIAYARGYRLNFKEGGITSTGIISVNSNPKAAKIYIDGELSGATDTNITLPYGDYDVEVKKEGYTSWRKNVNLKGEIVMSLNAMLFSKNPSLSPLTNLGISKTIAVPDSNAVILISKTGDEEKDGIYFFEANNQSISIFQPLKTVLSNTLVDEDLNIVESEIYFGPDNEKGILTIYPAEKEENDEVLTDDSQDSQSRSYLINIDQENTELFDITNSKKDIIEAWEKEKNSEIIKIVETFPKEIRKEASESAYLISVSPDENKFLYVAKQDAVLPKAIDPPIIGANQTEESRSIKKGSVYVYDKKEDKNFLINIGKKIDIDDFTVVEPENIINSDKEENLDPWLLNEDLTRYVQEFIRWYPSSDYLVLKENEHISVVQYDGSNKETIYAGPFEPDYFGITSDWDLMIVINLNPQANEFGDLYSVGVR